MKKILALAFLTTVSSCGKKSTHEEISKVQKIETITNDEGSEHNEQIADDENGDNSQEGLGPVDEVHENNLLKIKATLIDFDSTQKIKMENALKLLGEIINSNDFKQRILNHTYLGKKSFKENNNFSNQEIYDSILNGSEEQFVGNNNTLDLRINLYYSSRNVVGYTYSNKLDIYVNNKYFSKYELSSVAANVMHEWLHKLGYIHAHYYSNSRNYSVPYAIGDIVRELGQEIE
jgi:hypothetical protein